MSIARQMQRAAAKLAVPAPPPEPTYQEVVLADTPFAYWPLDDTNATALDVSGNGYHGTHTNAAYNQTPLITSGRSVNYNGSSALTTLGYTGDLRPAYSVECWVWSGAAPSTAKIAPVLFGNEKGQLVWDHTNSSFLGSFTHQTSTTWHIVSFNITSPGTYHLVGSYDGTTLRAYKNGVLINSKVCGAPDVGSESWKLAHGTASYFNGKVDELAFYNYALSSTQIQAHYNKGING